MATTQQSLFDSLVVKEQTNFYDDETMAQAIAYQEALSKRRINNASPELQERLMQHIERYLERKTVYRDGTGERIDYAKNGLLGELLARTPARIYDLPELKARCDTAFVDTTGRLYISDTFFRWLEADHIAGKISIDFIFSHEMDHLRRLHLQRMLDVPADIGNVAQDTRINLDIIRTSAAEAFREDNGRLPDRSELRTAIDSIYCRLGDSLKGGVAMSNSSEYDKWGDLTEEEIAAIMLKSAPQSQEPNAPDATISFPKLCEAVSQDLAAMSQLATSSNVASRHASLAEEVRRIGKSKGRVAVKQISDAKLLLDLAMASVEMTARNLQDETIKANGKFVGKQVYSVAVGDTFIESITPIERFLILQKSLDMVLNPTSGSSNSDSPEGLKIKDIDLPRTNNSDQKNKQKQKTGESKDRPGDNIYAGDDHIMSAEELASILEKAGVDNARKVLGYDDLEKIQLGEESSKENVVKAIAKACEDAQLLPSGGYAGAHQLHHAVQKMNDFHKPVLSIELQIRKIVEGVGNNVRFDHDEPWGQYYSSAEDQGLESEEEIGYMGSFVLSRNKRPVVVAIIDTSASVPERMLRGFASNAINLARENESNNSAEIVIVSADTLVREAPVLITAENYQDFLKTGLKIGGRTGTNFTATVENIFRLVASEDIVNISGTMVNNILHNRKIDAVIYFTDTLDAPPNQEKIEAAAFEAGMDKLPTMLFIAPNSCVNKKFEKGISNYAEIAYFGDDEKMLCLNDVEERLESSGLRQVR